MERLGAESFRGRRLLRRGTWVVAFLADWCPFCQRFPGEFSAWEGDPKLELAVGDVTSGESRLWDEFDIEVVPTLIVFRDGEPVFRVDGEVGVGLPVGALETARLRAWELAR